MAFDVDPIKNLYEKASRFVDWFVEEVFRNRNWSALLLLLDVILFSTFNPWQWPLKNLIDLFPLLRFPWYESVFSLVVLVILAAAIAVRARRRKSSIVKRSELKLSAIKGLLPFGHNADDIEIFASLQRERNLDECLQAMNDPQWRFGVLSGESGAGKTSFLQAALWPALEAQDYRCVYVKFSDLDPFQSVEQAFVKQLSLSNDSPGGDGFASLLSNPALQSQKPLILVLDQFEQFFVHLKRKKDRKPFVQALGDWYLHQQSLPIKILISVRGDFFYRLNELQQTMKYSLSPTQSFRLERFEPAQAAEIFCVIAEKERLEYNRGFITQMTKQELADTDDELVSPVDIQVLAWMVAGQNDVSNRAFNRTAFQKLGGVEGLLERFLARALDSRETESRRQTAIKVLLGLTDLERNTRAGALTIDALRDKLESDLSDADLKEAVVWLSRGDVRLVAPSSEDGEEKYELAHERIIPALRRLAGRTLEPVSRANQLLDSRVNEWVGNGRSSRYLFSFSELRLIKKQRPFITWDKTKSAKDGLIAASSKRLRIRVALSLLLVLLPTASWFVWNTNRVQIYLVRRDLEDLGLRLTDGDSLGQIATAFAVSGDDDLAQPVLSRIPNDFQEATAYNSIADTEARLGNSARAHELLESALKRTERIVPYSDKAVASKLIAATFAKLGDNERARALLEDALASTEAITNDSAKAGVLTSILDAASILEDKPRTHAFTEKAAEIANTISDLPSKADAQISTANAFVRLGDNDRAIAVTEKALKSVDAINGDSFKSSALVSIAELIARAYHNVFADAARIAYEIRAHTLLRGAARQAEAIHENTLRAVTVAAVSAALARIGSKLPATVLLEQEVTRVEAISDQSSTEEILYRMGLAAARIGEREQVREILFSMIRVNPRISDNSRTAARWLRLYEFSVGEGDRLPSLRVPVATIEEAFMAFERAQDDLSRYDFFKTITKSRLALNDIGRLRLLVSRFGEAYKVRALARILTVYSHPELAEENDEQSHDRDNDEAR